MMRYFIVFLMVSISSVIDADVILGTPDIDDIEYPDDEEHSREEIELGKLLFFDPRLSLNGQQSCATCHNPELGFSDGLAKGLGTMGDQLNRNAPHLYNLAWSNTFFWDGRASSLEEQALGPIEAAGEMNMPLDLLLTRLNKIQGYRALFESVYGQSEVNKNNLARAIAAFERSIISNNSAYDQFIKGDTNAMSPSAIRGLELFKSKAQCFKCHDGPNFTDDSFHNIGVNNGDIGRAGVDKSSGLIGAFKTPGLRNIILSAPYMHDGSVKTLEEVVIFYNKGGHDSENRDKLIKPLNLNNNEIADLVAFMGALTDPVIVKRPSLPLDQE